ncbi:hypothetical protein VE04_05396 [Pseudogymnoascus sp. 24MN13]|nr:hypothetical protein VE04_05396 [Pseudogymnoascus sp. 24MN13]
MAVLSKTGTFASYYLLWTFVVLSLAFPAELSSSSNAAEFSNFLPPNPFSKSVETRDPIANGATLRVLCLGASIMGGYSSTDKNGMRYALRSALAAHGNKVNMIGSINLGTMDDNKVESWPGYRIDQVAKKAELSLSKLPNVVAILAGTNDAGQGFDTPNMANRMATLIDRIFAVATGTTIILGTLPPMYEPADDIVRQYNSDLADLVSKRSAAGQKIFLADMHSPWWSLADISGDNVHPTNAGYLKMARVFYDGIIAANDSITPPKTPPGGISDPILPYVVGHGPTASDKTSGSTIGPIQTRQGSPPASSSASTLSTNQAKFIASQGTPYPTTVTARLASSSDSGSSYPTTVTTRPASSSESSSCQDSLSGCLTSLGANLSTCQANFAACQGSLGFTQPTVVGTNNTSRLPSATTSKTAIFTGAASFAKPAARFLALGALAFF